MGTVDSRRHVKEDIDALRTDSLNVMSVLQGCLCFFWLVVQLWMLHYDIGAASSAQTRWRVWAILILGLSAVLVRRLAASHPLAGALVLIVSLSASVGAAMMGDESSLFPYLMVVPVAVSSIVMRRGFTIVAAAIGLGFLLITHGMSGWSTPAADWLLASLAVVIVAVVATVSSRNLNLALEWAWGAYERSQRNERQLEERRGDLRKALKSLEEAMARSERTNELLKVVRTEAESAKRLKQQFAQTISHEMRTPLNLVIGFCELMAESPDYYGGSLPVPYLRDLMVVHRNASHLRKLVDDVLDLARLDAAQMTLTLAEIQPAHLLAEVADMMSGLVESHGLELVVEPHDPLPTIWADDVRIRQVFVNLIGNAVRFTTQGSITLSGRQQGSTVLFAVRDTGIGISPEDRVKVFDEFRQLDAETNRRHEGAGLGLAICRRFVELHGGRIWVESVVGQGSTFNFSLPATPRGGLSVDQHAPRLRERTELAPSQSRENLLLLVVTPSAQGVALLRRYVRDCRVINVTTLEAVQELVGQVSPRLVVIDSGAFALSAQDVKERVEQWGIAPSLVLLCRLHKASEREASAAVDGYLLKPVTRQAVQDVLRRHGEELERIVVVDDDWDFCRLMRRLLLDPLRQYDVHVAHSVEQAWRVIVDYRPQLVFMDVVLGDGDGYDLARRIRSDLGKQDTAIIMVSAQEETDIRQVTDDPMVFTANIGFLPTDIVNIIQFALDGWPEERATQE